MSKTYGDILHKIKKGITSRIETLQENIDNQKKNIVSEIDAGNERGYLISKATVQVNVDALDWQRELLVAAAKADASIELPRVCQIFPEYHNRIRVQMSGLDPFGKNHGGIGNFMVHTSMEKILNLTAISGNTSISKTGARLDKNTLFLLESGSFHSIRDHFHLVPPEHIRSIIDRMKNDDVSILSRDERKRTLVGWDLRDDHFEFRVTNFGDSKITVPFTQGSRFYTDVLETHLWAEYAFNVRHIIGASVE